MPEFMTLTDIHNLRFLELQNAKWSPSLSKAKPKNEKTFNTELTYLR